MQLSNYISNLLFNHDCVTVPGFGSFLGNYKSAQYDFKEQKFHPPSKQISFNSQIKDNDGLLAKNISKELDLPYDQAVKKIHQEVLTWTKKITTETIVLKNIGELYLSTEDKITFIPSNELNHLKESFGLSPIFVTELEGKKPLQSKKLLYLSKDNMTKFRVLPTEAFLVAQKSFLFLLQDHLSLFWKFLE